MAHAIVEVTERTFARLKELEWIPILLARLSVGYEFMASGWGKLHGLDHLAKYFAELGIPMPAANAALTATTECLGGALVIVGLATRFSSAALAFVMVIAILTAKLKEAHDLLNFLYSSEPLFLVIFVWLVFSGGGRISFDALIAKRRASART